MKKLGETFNQKALWKKYVINEIVLLNKDVLVRKRKRDCQQKVKMENESLSRTSLIKSVDTEQVYDGNRKAVFMSMDLISKG